MNADAEEEEETDKLLKKNHNEAVEEAVRQRKGSNKKEGKLLCIFRNGPVLAKVFFCLFVSTNPSFCF